MLDEMVEPLVQFVFGIRTIEANEGLTIMVSSIAWVLTSTPTGSIPSGTWSGGQECSERTFPATFFRDLLNRALVSGVS